MKISQVTLEVAEGASGPQDPLASYTSAFQLYQSDTRSVLGSVKTSIKVPQSFIDTHVYCCRLPLRVLQKCNLSVTYALLIYNCRVTVKVIFTARRYASAVYAVDMCPSVRHKSESYKKRLNVG